MQHNTRLTQLLFVSLILSILGACSPPGSPISVTASISPDPIVGQEVTLHVEVLAAGRDLPDTQVLISVPSGVELLDESLPWHGALQQDTPQVFDLKMRVVEAGEWDVWVGALALFGDSGSGSDTKHLIITSSVDSATVVDFADLPITPPPAFYKDQSVATTVSP